MDAQGEPVPRWETSFEAQRCVAYSDMPPLTDAIDYAQNLSTSMEELRRACEILQLPSTGPSEVLRARLRRHLETLDAGRPVVCLNPGPVRRHAAGSGLRLPRPGPDEFAAVFANEIAQVPEAPDFAALLLEQLDITQALAATFGEAYAGLRYDPEKWSVRETLGHLGDCERVLSYRLLRALRRDETVLPGFDEVEAVTAGRFEFRTLASVVEELGEIRAATAALIRNARPPDFAFRLSVGSGSITGLALAYLIAGHERQHQHLLRTRYLPCLPSMALRALGA
jgi:hypothetical protein